MSVPNTTPVVRCPLRNCMHSIDTHVGNPAFDNVRGLGDLCEGCTSRGCECPLTPNTIAVALLFGDLSEPATPSRATRKPNGSWE